MNRSSVVVDRVGGPEVLRIVEDESPGPAAGEVRIRMLAAGVAPADVQLRAGRYPGRAPRPPFVAGRDVTGVVDALGSGVSEWWRGRRVVALVGAGGHSSHRCVPVGRVVPLPDGVDEIAAACLPLNYVTAYEMLHQISRVESGETVLVHAAAGGVGTALLDLARGAGVRALAVAAETDRELITSYGAELATGSGPVDVVIDPLAGPDLPRSFAALRSGGRLVCYGFLATPGTRSSAIRTVLRLRLWSALPNGRRAMFYRVSSAAARHPARVHAALHALVDELAAGRLRPLVGARVPLHEAAAAHDLVERRGTRGKVLLVP